MGLLDLNVGNVGELLKDIREAITGEAIKDPIKKAELEAKIKTLENEVVKMQAQVITAEAKSEHWLTSTWRPIIMLIFGFIIFNNYVLVPYFSTLFSVKIPSLTLTSEMWELLKVGIGGYIIGRSAEKIATNYLTAKQKG